MTIQDISLWKLSGSKGAKKPTNTADSLFATDIVEALLGISEGPIMGLEDGGKSYLIGETNLQDQSGQNNFDNFELIDYKGSEEGEEIYSRLGGFGASTSVGTELATDVEVIRNGQHTDIDYLDVRMVINQLVHQNDKGTFNHTGKFKVEYKRVSESNWHAVRTTTSLPPKVSEASFDTYYGDAGESDKISASPGDRPSYWSESEPVTTATSGIWFDKTRNNRPQILKEGQWVDPTGLSLSNGVWSWAEASSWGKDKRTKAFAAASSEGLKYEQGDYFLNTGTQQALFYNGSTFITAGSSLRPGGFGENGTGGSIEVKNGEIAITAKTTSPFPKEFRIPVPRVDEPYMLRMTKTSPVDTTENFFSITWESFQEVTAQAYKFPALATTQLIARASEQFSSVPDFSGIYLGRIVRIPSNYNPVTRVYTGVWDLTWKLGYTNNPAFVTYDLVMNDRYGMNAYYPIVLNKMDIYEAGVWCDVRTVSGKPRFTFNGLISDPRGGRDAINYLCGIFAGRFFDDGNGSGVIRIDRDGSPAMTFMPENVVDGVFTYSFTEISTRHNDITVSFTNENLGWQTDRRRVHDQDHIDQYGRIPHNFDAVGCTDEEEAIRRARYHMITGITETMMVNFKTNRQGLYLSPYDMILVADEDMEFGLSGRVKNVSGPRTVQLRDPLFLENGFAYQISFTLISDATDDFIIERRDLTPTYGALTQLTVTEDLPELPENAVFTIEQINGDAAPVAFRVLSLNEIDGDPDNVDIQAIVMNRAKWLYVDGLVDTIAETLPSSIGQGRRPDPVGEIRVAAQEIQLNGRKVYDLQLEWDASPTKTVTYYRVRASRNNDAMNTMGEPGVTQFSWTDVPAGEYLFEITAMDAFGNESMPRQIEHRFIGDYRAVEAVLGLRMMDEPYETVFESQSPRFEWVKNAAPDHAGYVLQIRKLDGAVVREEPLAGEFYQYEYAKNVADNGVALRSFTVAIASKDQYGFLSPFQTLTVSNTAPAAPKWVYAQNSGVSSIIVDTNAPTERDFQNVIVHASTQQGFVPSESTIVYEGPNNNITIVIPGAKYYLRVGFSDTFSHADLNWYEEVAVEVKSIAGDTIAPEKPTGLAATSIILPTGEAETTWTWNQVPDLDLQGYVFEIKEGAGNWLDAFAPSNQFVTKSLPGVQFTVRVLAYDTSGNKSAFSDEFTYQVARDTVPPAVPTGLEATGTFKGVWLEWDANTEIDFDHYELYEADAPTPAPVQATVPTFTGLTGTTTYRSNLPASTSKSYFLRAVDTSGNKSAWSAVSTTSTLSLEGTQPAPAVPVAPTLSSALFAQNDGGFIAKVTVSWAAVANASSYQVGVTRSGASETVLTAGNNSLEFDGLPGVTYTVRVLSVGNVGQKSAFGTAATITPAGDTVAPAAPVISTAQGGFNIAWLEWSLNTENDFDYYEVYQSTSNVAPAADATATYKVGSTAFSITDIAGPATVYFWVRAVDTSKNKSAWSAAATVNVLSLSGTQPAPAVPTALAATSSVVAVGTDFVAKVKVTWTVSANSVSYEVGITRAGAAETLLPASTNSIEFDGVPGVAYTINVKGVNNVGTKGAATANITHTAAVDTAAPAVPTGLIIDPGFEVLWLQWTRNTESDFSHYEIYESTTTTAPAVGAAPSYVSATNQLIRQGLAAGTALNYWLRSVDFSGNKSAWSARVGATAGGLQSTDISGLVDATSVAAGLSIPGVGAALPATPFTDKTPKTYYLTTTGIIYKQKTDGTGWIAQSDASLIVGKIVAGQIEVGAVGADQLAANAVRAKHILIGDPTNVIDRGWSKSDQTGWQFFNKVGFYEETATAFKGQFILAANGREHAISDTFEVTGGEGWYVEAYYNNTATEGAVVFLHTWAPGGTDTFQAAPIGTVKNAWAKAGGILTVPAGHTKANVYLICDRAGGTTGPNTYWTKPLARRATGTILLENGAVTADKVTTGELITLSAQIKSATINNAHIISLDAGKISAVGVLAGNILVQGSTGQTLADIQNWSTDPATRINQVVATKIDPGKIVISGATTLADWRHGSNTTTIDGGKIFAGSVTTEALTVVNNDNLIEDSMFRAGFDMWSVSNNFPASAGYTYYIAEAGSGWAAPSARTAVMRQTSGPVGGQYYSDMVMYRNDPNIPAAQRYNVPCAPGEWFEASVALSVHRCLGELRIEFRNAAGVPIAYAGPVQVSSGGQDSTNAENWPRVWCKGLAPAGAASVGIHIRKTDTAANTTDSYVFVYKPMLSRTTASSAAAATWADGTVTRITGGMINANAINANHVTTGEFITLSAQIRNAIINDAHVSTLSAGKLTAGSALAGSITVSGSALSTVVSNAATGAQDPATRINAAATKIDPGKIVISGAATLADWRGTSDTTLINGGKIQTDSIEVRSLKVGNFANIIDDGWTAGSLGSWQADQLSNFYIEGGNAGSGGGYNLQTTGSNVVSRMIPCSPGQVFGGSVWCYNTSAGRVVYYIQWFDPSKAYLGSAFINFSDVKNQWVKLETGNQVTAPAGASYLRAHLHREGNPDGNFLYWNKPTLYMAYGGQLIVSGSIEARHLITNSAVITGTAQIADAIVSSAKIVSLNANKIEAWSVLSNTIYVAGGSGQTMGDIQNWATDPGTRINQANTRIDPGRIIVSGATSLSDWRGTTDTTKINGGSIETNSIRTRSLVIQATDANLITNGDFEDGLNGWTIADNAGSGNGMYLEGWGSSGTNSLTLMRGTNTSSNGISVLNNYMFPVESNAIYEFTMMARAYSTAGLYMRVHWHNAAKAAINPNYTDVIGNGSVPSDAFTRVGGQVTAPGDAKFARIQIFHWTAATNNYLVFDEVIFRKVLQGTSIQDGAITTYKISAGAIWGDRIAGGAITGTHVAAGTLTADKAAFGTSANLIPNSDFGSGMTGWAAWFSGGSWAGPSLRTDQFGIATGSLEVVQTGAQTNGQFADVFPRNDSTGVANRFNVTGGGRYELSVYVYGHRSDYCRAHIEWRNANGDIIDYSYWDGISHQNGGPDKNIGYYTRVGGVAVAPANARYAQIFFRCWGHSAAYGTDSYTWLAHPYFGECLPNQTELSNWSSTGLTIITSGNIVTGAITADKIGAGQVTADKMNVTSLSAISATLGSVNISNAVIGTLQVGSSNISPGAVTNVSTATSSATNGIGGGDTAQRVATVSQNPAGNPCIVIVTYKVKSDDANQSQLGAALIKRNGTTLRTYVTMAKPITTSNLYDIYTLHMIDNNPPAGNNTYSFDFRNSGNSTIIIVADPEISCIVFKR
jgi:predicted phage tail protein